MGSQHVILQVILCLGFCGFDLLARFVALLHKVSISFSILVSGLCMLYHNFYCIFFPLSPSDKAWSQLFI
jgi:hypothetical protein